MVRAFCLLVSKRGRLNGQELRPFLEKGLAFVLLEISMDIWLV